MVLAIKEPKNAGKHPLQLMSEDGVRKSDDNTYYSHLPA